MATNLSSDIYEINDYINKIKKNYTEGINEDTLLLGIFGYIGQIHSDMIQNSIIMASEFANEGIPTKAKFEKNIIAHALSLGITDITATPAQIDVLLTIIEEDIKAQATYTDSSKKSFTFVFDKNNAIYFGDYEFHTDYDIIIKGINLNNAVDSNGNMIYNYTATYDIDVENPISDVTNPYLTPPVRMNVNGSIAIFTNCTIRQVEKTTLYKTVLVDNSIEAKTFTFDFNSQLAAFTIDVTESGGATSTHMIPVYEGLTVSSSTYPYFYYTYLDTNTIRIKFDSTSYMPRVNCTVQINLQTTQGESGNFTWSNASYPQFIFDSERLGYTNLACEIRPVTGSSENGADKKTIDELKKIIPKEALSRNSIANVADLENFFNSINTDDSKIYIYKKKDNALERLYYTYLLIKNDSGNIIPTNTIDILINPSELTVQDGSTKKILPKETIIKYDPITEIGTVILDTDPDPYENPSSYSDYFLYKIPYNIAINTSPLYVLYQLSTMNTKKALNFNYINDECFYQFIATNITWRRKYLTDTNKYSLSINIEQNINDTSMLIKDDSDNVIGVNIRCILVVYNDNNEPYRWIEGTYSSYTSDTSTGLIIFTFDFSLTTNDYINTDNEIQIIDMKEIGADTVTACYLSASTKSVIHIISKQSADYGLYYAPLNDTRYDLTSIVPNLTGEGYSLSNSYLINEGIDFFYDYSEYISSIVTVESTDENIEGYRYRVKNIPSVKYDYFSSESRVEDFVSELIKRRNYIEYALDILEDSFGIDFKLFNTYGPSKKFSTTTSSADCINKVNLTLRFKLKLRANYDINILTYIINDIKEYIEDINEISDIHISNIVSTIENTYSESIVFFEFVDMNGYGLTAQHIYNLDVNSTNNSVVPEFININTLDDDTPDITIIII